MALTPPVTVAQFKTQFNREFVYGAGLDSVQDADINRAFSDALLVFNPNLWDSTTEQTAFLYASAHFLVINIQAAGGLIPVVTNAGVVNRANSFSLNRSVGDVALGNAEPPEIVKRYAGLQPFWATDYGQRYVQMMIPRMMGALVVVRGEQNPDAVPE